MPVHSDTKGMGAHMPTEKPGVRSPFHAGGGGGGGGGGSGAATQVLDGGSNTVPTRIRRLTHPRRNHCYECERRQRAAPMIAER